MAVGTVPRTRERGKWSWCRRGACCLTPSVCLAAALGSEQAAAAAAFQVGNTSSNAPAASSPSPVTSPTTSDPASPPSVAQEPAAQEARNPALAQPAQPGGLMILERIDGLFTGSE